MLQRAFDISWREELVSRIQYEISCSCGPDEGDGLRLCEQNSHKVMTALIVVLPSNCCCGDFFAKIIDMCSSGFSGCSTSE
jgi:hypothetical protein